VAIISQLRKARLYGILDLGYVKEAEAPTVARRMLEGGVQILQLRAKKMDAAQFTRLALALAPLCRDHDVPFILNDHPELVHETGADGAHVGQDDTSVAEARCLAGDRAIIGKSTHSLAQAVAAQAEAPDYLGFGPLFATATKPDYKPIGLSEIAQVHRKVPLPVFCIGGIKRENLPTILAAGAVRIVIVSGILTATCPLKYISDCLRELEKHDANSIVHDTKTAT